MIMAKSIRGSVKEGIFETAVKEIPIQIFSLQTGNAISKNLAEVQYWPFSFLLRRFF